MKLNFNGLLSEGDRVAVALSGGKDSVALLNVLKEESRALKIQVLAVNVEHGIRGEFSVADSDFVKKLCERENIPLISYAVNVPVYAKENKMSIETAARKLRYECFFKAIDNGFCDKIATAHHADDDAETVLMNLFRGCGFAGLYGIAESSYGGKIIRPMLSVTRKQIDAYIAKKRLNFVTDETNSDNAYSRNYIRNVIIPAIEEKYPDFRGSLKRLGKICKTNDEFILSHAMKLISVDNNEKVRIKITEDFSSPVFLRAAIEGMRLAGLTKDYEAVHAQAVAELAQNNTGASVNLPHDFTATKGYGEVIISKNFLSTPFAFPFRIGKIVCPYGVLTIEKIELPPYDRKQLIAFFAQEKSKGVLYASIINDFSSSTIRNKSIGDKIRAFGGGEKSLKAFLIDKKIEKAERDGLPVCAIGKNVLFIGGTEVSSIAAVKETDTHAYKITYEKN